MRDADALIIRTRTKANKALLEHSSVRFIATATIGFDHLDESYLREHGITYCSCPGCNAQAVCDYVEEALYLGQQIVLMAGGQSGGTVAEVMENKWQGSRAWKTTTEFFAKIQELKEKIKAMGARQS